MTASSLVDLGIAAISTGYRDRSWSPVEVVRDALARMEDNRAGHSRLGHSRRRGSAQRRAGGQRELRSGIDRGPLHGIPVGVKDIFDVAGFPTRCGSAARDDAPPAAADAPTVARPAPGSWRRPGQDRHSEFAAGVISAPARNPWDTSRSPGGSSAARRPPSRLARASPRWDRIQAAAFASRPPPAA